MTQDECTCLMYTAPSADSLASCPQHKHLTMWRPTRDAILLQADTAEPGPEGPYRVYPPEPWAKGEAYSGKPPIEKVYYYVSESDAPGHRIEFYSRRESAARAVCHALNRVAARSAAPGTGEKENP